MTSAAVPRSRLADAAALGILFVLVGAMFFDAVSDAATIPAGVDLLQHYSRESFIRRAFAAGVFPLWNPYEFSGFPVQADLQTGMFYPPSVILRFLSLPSFLTWTVVFHVWLFGAGGYALARYLGVGRPVALVAGVALMFGGITMPRVYAGHLDVLRTVAWIPLALALAFRSIDRASIWPSAALVLVLACQLLGSFVQLSTYTFAAIALYATFSIAWPRSAPRSWKHAGATAGQVLILVVLVSGTTAFQLLPTARLAQAAGRTGGMPYKDAVVPNVGREEFLRFLTPTPARSDVPSESWETSAYVGVLLIALAPLALLSRGSRRMAVFLVILAAIALALASGSFLYAWHYSLAPMFRIPGRLLPFWAVPVAALGAMALGWLTGHLHPATQRTGVWRRVQGAGLIAAGLLVVADVSSYARSYVEPRTFESRFPQAAPLVPSAAGRVLSTCESKLNALELSALGIPNIDGYNSYFLADYARLALLARGIPSATYIPAFPRIGDESTLPDIGRISMLNTTDVVSCDPIKHTALVPAGERPPFYFYKNARAAGRVVTARLDGRPCDESALDKTHRQRGVITGMVADRPDGRTRFVFSSGSSHLLLLSEPYYPERDAFIDGVETTVHKMRVALSGICVPPGTHVVEMRYVPSSLWLGAGISLTTLVTWGAARRGRRR